MSRLLQALALALLATLTTATSAAALSAQNRIKAPSESTHSRVGPQALLTPQTHQGIDAATTTIASEMPLAPGGGGGPPRGYVSGFREIMAKARAAKAGDVQALGEIQAAKVLRAEGRNVHFQTPVGPRGPGTADFLVGGQRGTGAGGEVFDVITPRTPTPANVALGVAGKNDQAPNIIVNIRNNPHLTRQNIGGEAQLLRDVHDLIEPAGGTVNIRTVRIIE